MSRHISRKERWFSNGPGKYRSVEGFLVRPFKGEWWADITYSLRSESATGDRSEVVQHIDQLGPFRRPRNAMVEAERHATTLRNRHGVRLQFTNAG